MKILRALAAFVVVLLLIAGGAALWARAQTRAFLEAAPSPEHEERILEIPRGAGPQRIARLLAEQGVVTDAERFALFLRFREAAPKLRAGQFRFFTDQTPEQVLQTLLEAREVTYPVTLPEGLRYVEMAPRVEAAGLGPAQRYVELAESAAFIAGLDLGIEPTPATLEGILMPETYSFPSGATVDDLVGAQVDRWKATWDERRQARAAELGFSPYELTILASVVEKESGRPDDRTMVAGVFHHRLRIGMPLQSDPTIIYGLKDFDGDIRRSDIRKPHPWNTYVIPALPPTPIAGVGVEAIDAVLWPADTKALYFVARGDGTTHFSSTLAEHNRMVDCYQRGRSGRCP